MQKYRYGKKSSTELSGGHPDLRQVFRRALQISGEDPSIDIDWAIHDCIRTLDEQKEYVRTGVSRTLKSRHLKQADGYSHAVDAVPYVNRKLRWEWPAIYRMAKAVHQAACELGVRLTWGAVWDRSFTNLDPTLLEDEVEAYVARRKKKFPKRKVFVDGPHWQLRI